MKKTNLSKVCADVGARNVCLRNEKTLAGGNIMIFKVNRTRKIVSEPTPSISYSAFSVQDTIKRAKDVAVGKVLMTAEEITALKAKSVTYSNYTISETIERAFDLANGADLSTPEKRKQRDKQSISYSTFSLQETIARAKALSREDVISSAEQRIKLNSIDESNDIPAKLIKKH